MPKNFYLTKWINGGKSKNTINIRIQRLLFLSLFFLRGLYGHMDGTYDWYSIDDFVKDENARIVGKN